MSNADEFAEFFPMSPVPQEGGYYLETFRSDITIDFSTAGTPHNGHRSLSTAIYYMLTNDSCSSLHKLTGDEVYHFYAGDPVELLQLFPDGSSATVVLGQDFKHGMRFQHTVQGGVWQGSKLLARGRCAILGTTMAPGFDPRDFVKGDPELLAKRYPDRAELILQLG
jgi:predicted cupin superfamily sugar epimerase